MIANSLSKPSVTVFAYRPKLNGSMRNAGSTRDYYVFAEPRRMRLGVSATATSPLTRLGQKPIYGGFTTCMATSGNGAVIGHDEYPDHDVTDPLGPDHGSYKVKRGGSWAADLHSCNAHIRKADSPRGTGLSDRLRLVFSA